MSGGSTRWRPHQGFVVMLSDESMLDVVRAALRQADPMPRELIEFGRLASWWRGTDAVLADAFSECPDGGRSGADDALSEPVEHRRRWLTPPEA